MSTNKTPAKKATPPRLTIDQLDKIKQADVANLIRKVKSGKTLSTSERKMLENAAMPDEELPARQLVTTSRLAELFGINRKTVAQWRLENKPGIPNKVDNKEDISAWRSWFAANPDAGHGDGKPRKDRETLLCEKLEIDIAIKDMHLDEMMGLLISRAEVLENMTKISTSLAAFIARAIADLPGIVEGLPRSKSAPIIKARLRELQTKFADSNSEFWKDHPEKKVAAKK